MTRKYVILQASAIVCAVFAIYATTFSMGFVWDDIPAIRDNELIKRVANIPAMLTMGIPPAKAVHYRPLILPSLALDYSVWGLNAGGYHLTNVLFHCGAALAVFGVARTMLHPASAFFSALLFAVHPVHADGVSWIIGRADVFCGFFLVLSMFFYIKWYRQASPYFLFLSIAAFVPALLSKEPAVLLPLTILLYDACFGSPKTGRRFLGALLYVLPVSFYLLLRFHILAEPMGAVYPLPDRLFTAAALTSEYARLLVFPATLKVLYHEIPVYKGFFHIPVVTGTLIVVLVALTLVVAWRTDKRIFFGLGWLLVMIAPVSGLPTIIDISPAAERYLYVPSIGFVLVAGRLLEKAFFGWSEKSRSPLLLTVFSIVLLLGGRTFFWNETWRDQKSFLEQMVRDAPRYHEARKALAAEYLRRGMIGEAERELVAALALDPSYGQAWNDLAALYMQQNRLDEAEQALRSAVGCWPDGPEVRYNLGVILLATNRAAAAEFEFRRALERIQDEDARLEILLRIAEAQLIQGRYRDAQALLRSVPAPLAADERVRSLSNKAGEFSLRRVKR